MSKYDERDADILKLPFAYQQKVVLRFLQEQYHSRCRAMALLVYNTISWIVSDFSNEESNKEVYNWPRVIATYSGMGIGTVRKYIKDFVGFGIIRQERYRRKNGAWDTRRIIIPATLPPEVYQAIDSETISGETVSGEADTL